jgi:hypothetical protein
MAHKEGPLKSKETLGDAQDLILTEMLYNFQKELNPHSQS